MILGLRHTGIVVSNMDKALTFYQGLLGLSIVVDCIEEGPYIEKLVGVEKAVMRIVKLRVTAPLPEGSGPRTAYDGVIELLQFLNSPADDSLTTARSRLGISHLAFAVKDVDMLHREWSQKGIVFNHPPQWSPDKAAKVAYAHDPDGTVIEVVQLA
jgi:catechol 2,3-dioxygenase-like lactoylglutathione lyase family enzyme